MSPECQRSHLGMVNFSKINKRGLWIWGCHLVTPDPQVAFAVPWSKFWINFMLPDGHHISSVCIISNSTALPQDTYQSLVVVWNIVYFHPYLGKWSNLTNIFQMGWNHQLEKIWYKLIAKPLHLRCLKNQKPSPNTPRRYLRLKWRVPHLYINRMEFSLFRWKKNQTPWNSRK